LIESLRCQDVALLAVGVMQQRDAGRPVRVVLDVRDLGGYAVLVVTTKVHDTVCTFVPTTLMPGRHPATRVPATLVVQRTDQRLLRIVPGDLREVGDARLPSACRYRLVVTNCHLRPQRFRSACSPPTASRPRAWCPCGGRSRSGCVYVFLCG